MNIPSSKEVLPGVRFMAATRHDLTPYYEFDSFRLIPCEHLLLCNDTPVPLPPKAFETLVLLVEHSGHLVEKDELMRKLWPDSFVEEANLTHHIWTIRKALGDGENGQHYILTVPRRGYRFVADVKRSNSEPENLGAPIVPKSAERNDVKVAVHWRPTHFAAFLIVALVLVAVGIAYFTHKPPWPRIKPEGGKITLLVLPFENPNRDQEEQYFSDGMTEEMITELTNLRPDRLRVIARTSAVQVTSSGKNLDQIARELGVDYVLNSNVFRFNDRVRINARLINAHDQSSVWAHSYERELRDVLILQNEVARSISHEILVQLNETDDTRPTNTHQINPQALEAYLKGLYFFAKFSESGMKTSIEYFQQAIDKEPGFAPAYARMARAYGVLGNFSSLRPEEAYPKQKEAAQKALEIDPTLGEARTALGWTMLFYDRDWNGAREQFERAIELNPNLPAAYQGYATYLVAMGDFDRGLHAIRQAQQLDPVNLNIKGDVGWNLFFARRTDESIAELKQVLEMDPNFSPAHFFLACAYQEKGMFEQAIVEAQKAVSLFESNEYRIGILGEAYARGGKKVEARNVLTRLKRASRDHYISPYTTGLIYASLGQTNEALNWLEKACNDRFWMMAFLKVDPRWDSLRSNPRFIDILRRTGFPS